MSLRSENTSTLSTLIFLYIVGSSYLQDVTHIGIIRIITSEKNFSKKILTKDQVYQRNEKIQSPILWFNGRELNLKNP